MNPLRCPVCKAENSVGPNCRRCKADLSQLFALEEQREVAMTTARWALRERRYDDAHEAAMHADHLRRDVESRRLVAVTALFCGEYAMAWRLHQEEATSS